MNTNSTNKQIFEYVKQGLNTAAWNDVANKLRNTSIDVNLRDEQNNYLIQYAVLYRQLEVVKVLVQRGCKLDIIDKEGHGLCYLPIKYNYIDILKQLISYDKNQIGIHLADFQDDYGYTPLHYAVMFDNKDAFDALIPVSNPNIRDHAENNVLHLAVSPHLYPDDERFERQKYYVDTLVKANASATHKNNDQLTSLHLAAINGNDHVIKTLIDHANDIHVRDQKYKTPLMYLIENGNFVMTQYVLSKTSDIYHQDVFGNNILHYAIQFQHPDIMNIVLPLFDKCNQQNIDSMTPLHFLLANNREINKYAIDVLLQKTNVNIQDETGNTILHYLVSLDIWHHFTIILEKKKMNILVRNKQGKTPLDLATNKKGFIALVTLSYYNILQNKDRRWIEEWENQCNTLQMKAPRSKEECLKIIEKYLDKKSVPFHQDKYCVKVDQPRNVDMTTFTGTSLDVLSGCLLLNTPTSMTLLSKDFVHNKQIEDHYKALGYQKNHRTEFYNFEVMWIFGTLFFPTSMPNIIKKFTNDKQTRFLVMPLGIELAHGAHSNILVYDKTTNTMERFEPNGSEPPFEFYYKPLALDKQIQEYFSTYFSDMKYLRPKDFLPRIGFQSLEEFDTAKRIGDPGGFCVAWSIWYASQRIKHPILPPLKLVKKLIMDIKMKNIMFRNFIRAFSVDITDVRSKLLGNVDVNDWINNTVTDDEIKKITNNIKASVS